MSNAGDADFDPFMDAPDPDEPAASNVRDPAPAAIHPILSPVNEPSPVPPAPSRQTGRRMTPTQMRVFDELLAVGGSRPVAPLELASQLRTMILRGTSAALDRWTEKSMYASKSLFETVGTCEGKLVADRSTPRTGAIPAPTAIGIMVHRAIQLGHTHPGRSVEEYVRLALAGSLAEDAFRAFWDNAPEYVQSDCLTATTSRVTGFWDSFPPLDPTWTPRFEESIAAKIGRLTLSARPDLVLGRPKATGHQTMFFADIKSADLRDHHDDEGRFYALVATLRYEIPPFRSTVYSLASGEWSNPDVTADILRAAANRVITGVNAAVDVLTGSRSADLRPDRHCDWCPAKGSCTAASAWFAAGRPDDTATFDVITPRTTEPPATPPASPAPSAADAAVADVSLQLQLVEMPDVVTRRPPAPIEPRPIPPLPLVAPPTSTDVAAVGDDPWALD